MRFKVVCLSIIAASAITGLAFAQEMNAEQATAPAETDMAAPVAVGNTICPVMGTEIPADQMGVNTVEYNGKVYNVCSPEAKETFMAEPEKYSKIADDSMMPAQPTE